MNSLEEREISCPYCGEVIAILLDCSVHEQNYIEDCQVCCRPISFKLWQDFDGDINLTISHENEV